MNRANEKYRIRTSVQFHIMCLQLMKRHVACPILLFFGTQRQRLTKMETITVHARKYVVCKLDAEKHSCKIANCGHPFELLDR